MGLTPDLKDFDHTIHDSRGIVGVKDGIEYPVSKEEWQKAHPEHRNTDCKECTFALDAASILSFHVPKEVRDKANHEPKFIGKFTMPGWTGHSSFYLFMCEFSGTIVVDYPHGYTTMGSCYLNCVCGNRLLLKKREDYERDSISVPLIAFTKKEIWENSKKLVEEFEKLKPINIDDNEGVDISSKTIRQRIKSFFRLKP